MKIVKQSTIFYSYECETLSAKYTCKLQWPHDHNWTVLSWPFGEKRICRVKCLCVSFSYRSRTLWSKELHGMLGQADMKNKKRPGNQTQKKNTHGYFLITEFKGNAIEGPLKKIWQSRHSFEKTLTLAKKGFWNKSVIERGSSFSESVIWKFVIMYLGNNEVGNNRMYKSS